MKNFLVAIVILFAPIYQSWAASPDDVEIRLQELATDLAHQLASKKVKKLAIVEFSDLAGRDSTLGLFIAEEISSGVFKAKPGEFDIIERRHLQKVLEEQQLSHSALFNPTTIAKLGKVLGIDAVITGSIADLGTDMKVNARAIDVSTALVFASASSRFRKDSIVKQLLVQHAPDQPTRAVAIRAGKSDVSMAPNGLVPKFLNELFEIEVRELAASEDKKNLTLSLDVANITGKSQTVAIRGAGYQHKCVFGIIDNKGNSFSASQAIGIPCIDTEYVVERPYEHFVKISPKSTTSIVFSAVNDSRNQKLPKLGDRFSFSMTILVLNEEKIESFPAGISGIAPAQ